MKPFFLEPSENLVNTLSVDNSTRLDDVYTEIFPSNIATIEVNGADFTFICQNNIKLRISFHSADIVRFRYIHDLDFGRDFSYCIDPNYKREQISCTHSEDDLQYELSNGKLKVCVEKSDLRITIYDENGVEILADENGFYAYKTIMNGLTEIGTTFKTTLNESFYGMGDKTRPFNLKGTDCTNYCTDAFAYGTYSDELYRSIPFYLGLNSGHGYGIFLDNSYKSKFDFDTEGKNVVQMAAKGGELNYYFINGPQLLDVVEKYSILTGTPELPPMWALGFHQCRWSYYPDTRVRELANDFRSKKIPCDAIYLDIDYMDEYKCFTWSKQYFPEMKKLVSDLKADGFSTVVMIDPGIYAKNGYDVYDSGVKIDAFCRRSSGDVMFGPVWPPKCVWPDYTKKEVREWWGELYKELYNDIEIEGFWNDMNEPAVFKVNEKTFPENVMHHFEGAPTNHAQIHNVYGMQMSRASQEGLKKLQPEKRPFILTRASSCGGQRFAALWTGDNISDWGHLHLANLQSQRLNISGFSLVGSDIGGFAGYPDGELLTRWLQMGIFHPVYRVHSMGKKNDGSAEVDEELKLKEIELTAEERADQEPWVFGDPYTEVSRKAIELRYQLLPYIYTYLRKNSQKGTPLIKNLIFVHQNDGNCKYKEDEFIFGEHLLVSPVVEQGQKSKKIYLPKGNWYDFWNNSIYFGEKNVQITTTLEKFPFFVESGTVLTLYPVRQHTKEVIDTLTLKIYKGNNITEFYEDQGDGYEYNNGNYLLHKIEQVSKIESTQIQFHTEGSSTPNYQKINIDFIGFENISKLLINGESFEVTRNDDKNCYQLMYPSNVIENIVVSH